MEEERQVQERQRKHPRRFFRTVDPRKTEAARPATDASIHYLAGQRIYPSRVNRRHKLRVEPQSQNCLGYARQGRATISFNLGCVSRKKTREILSLHTSRPCCGRWWTAMGGRKTCVDRRFPKRSVALESITRAAGIPHLQELSVLL